MVMMDNRNLLDVLKAELIFIEQGGYRTAAASSWKPPFIFQDSPTCLNCGNPKHKRPCVECLLIQFVPFEHWADPVPCRHIPLNDRGETIESSYHWGTQEEIETVVATWLKTTIDKIERGKHDVADESNVEAASA
jgi:hypothetical protein